MVVRDGQSRHADPALRQGCRQRLSTGQEGRSGRYDIIDEQDMLPGQKIGTTNGKEPLHIHPSLGRGAGRLAGVVAQAAQRPVNDRHTQPFRNTFGRIIRLIVSPSEQTPHMERHGYDTIDSGIKSASGQIASEPASQLIGRTPAAPVLEIMNDPLPGTP